MADPTEETRALMSVACGRAYHKTFAQKAQSKVGFKIRMGAKPVGKKVVAFGLSKVPLVGSELSTAFTLGSQKAEEIYKKKKAEKLKRIDEDDPRWAEAVKASLKSMTINDAMKSIDQSYKKARMSADECRKHEANLVLDSCAEAFYRLYRLRHRSEKLKIKLDALREMLADLGKIADNLVQYSEDAQAELVGFVNDFCKDHLDGDCTSTFSMSEFKDICLNTQEGRNRMDRVGEKARLLLMGEADS